MVVLSTRSNSGIPLRVHDLSRCMKAMAEMLKPKTLDEMWEEYDLEMAED